MILMFIYSHLLCGLQQEKSQQLYPDHAEKSIYDAVQTV